MPSPSVKQTIASVLLMTGVYVSNVVYDDNDGATPKNESSPGDGHGPPTTLGSCHKHAAATADGFVNRLLKEYYYDDDRVFYDDALGRYCLTKLNATVDADDGLTVYGTHRIPVHGAYETDKVLSAIDYDSSFFTWIRTEYAHLEFVDRTSVELSFPAHPYDDVRGNDNESRGFVVYAVRDDDRATAYVMTVGTRAKIYVIRYADERSLAVLYERHVSRVLENEPDCRKYVRCAEHVKKTASRVQRD